MKIHFSYIFDEELERVYECFTDVRINNEIAFKGLISKLKLLKGEKFDEEKSEFTAIWKDYYELKMVVENVKNEQSFKTYTYRALYIDKIPTEISLVFSFYWNSIDENTIFILDFYYKDEFFGDLFKTEFNVSDKQQICINIENYLTSIIKGLKIFNSVVIKSNFENIWKNISSPKSLFNLLFKDFIIFCKDEEISLNSEIIIFSKMSNSSQPIPLIKFKADSIIISSKFCKLSFISSQKLSIPNQRLTISIKFLDKNKTLFEVNIKLLEFTTHEAVVSLRKLWKKMLIDFINFFESKNKKK
jgi:hypothetical protein